MQRVHEQEAGAGSARAGQKSGTSKISQKSLGRYMGSLGLFLVILVFGIVLSILSPVFLSTTNIVNLLIQSTILAALAIGSTFVIMTGGIDQSVGSVLAVSSAVGLGLIEHHGMPVIVGVLVSLIIGIAFGIFNGFIITRFQVPALIVTLASMGIGRGIILIYTNGANISPVPDSYVYLANGRILGIPVILLLVGLLAVIAHIILSNTVYGRSVYASGGNELAARLAGIRTKRVITMTYVLSGLMAAVAGILLSARLESAGPTAGNGIELTVIAAVVIGGTSLFGGQGNILGTLLGVLLISLVSNAVNLLGVPPAWDQLVKGVVILVAALLDVYRRKYSKAGLSK
ncbi:ABC transporter permease [Cohnella sp. GbtcB17]|uniref:ABC transporter permease n=1 Tax=Cohnella sp. GbtcB17 TaxID=2824762 RepID=UPI001C2FA462|nr:ABC transporter permease [Cohnella sp. GbtcB17]